MNVRIRKNESAVYDGVQNQAKMIACTEPNSTTIRIYVLSQTDAALEVSEAGVLGETAVPVPLGADEVPVLDAFDSEPEDGGGVDMTTLLQGSTPYNPNVDALLQLELESEGVT